MIINNGLVNGDDDEPVDGEEEMVDADGDGIPLRGLEAARTKSFTCFQVSTKSSSQSLPPPCL